MSTLSCPLRFNLLLQTKKVSVSLLPSSLHLWLYSLIDAIIHSRITNDEKIIKKVVKRFHNYASVAFTPSPETSTATVDDARENFLIDLASFHLSLKKAVLVCEAEARQVEEYEREKQKIGRYPSQACDPTH